MDFSLGVAKSLKELKETKRDSRQGYVQIPFDGLLFISFYSFKLLANKKAGISRPSLVNKIQNWTQKQRLALLFYNGVSIINCF